jgi:hypothetical protein
MTQILQYRTIFLSPAQSAHLVFSSNTCSVKVSLAKLLLEEGGEDTDATGCFLFNFKAGCFLLGNAGCSVS